jgi:hypothetical protein
MSADVRVLTGASLGVPAILLASALATAGPGRRLLVGVCVLVVLLYAGVWLAWRPTRFVVDAGSLRIVWPLRTRVIARQTIVGVRRLTRAEFRAEHGWGVRIGAGGLWGGFGLLATRRTTFSMWISRTDRVVLVDLRDARPLLLTPDDPDRFVAALAS